MEGLCVNTIVKSRYRILPANKPGTRLLERKDPNRAIELLEVASLIELQYSPAARSQPVWSAANTSGLACPGGRSCRARWPDSSPRPYHLPAPEPAPPSRAHRGLEPASKPHWLWHAPAPGFPILPRAVPPLPDTNWHRPSLDATSNSLKPW